MSMHSQHLPDDRVRPDRPAALIVLLVDQLRPVRPRRALEEGRSLRRLVGTLPPPAPGRARRRGHRTLLVLAYRGVGLPVLFASIAVLRSSGTSRSRCCAPRTVPSSSKPAHGSSSDSSSACCGRSSSAGDAGEDDRPPRRRRRALREGTGEGGRLRERERDEIHAAGLLHEIGKFTWPDRVLHAEAIARRTSRSSRTIPRRARCSSGRSTAMGRWPTPSSTTTSGSTACGYPAGLIGNEIPLASRILAICCTYHTMTAGQGYRLPMTAQGSTRGAAERRRATASSTRARGALHRAARTRGRALAEDTDFETELEFERRVREHRRSRAHPSPHPRRAASERRPALALSRHALPQTASAQQKLRAPRTGVTPSHRSSRPSTADNSATWWFAISDSHISISPVRRHLEGDA